MLRPEAPLVLRDVFSPILLQLRRLRRGEEAVKDNRLTPVTQRDLSEIWDFTEEQWEARPAEKYIAEFRGRLSLSRWVRDAVAPAPRPATATAATASKANCCSTSRQPRASTSSASCTSAWNRQDRAGDPAWDDTRPDIFRSKGIGLTPQSFYESYRYGPAPIVGEFYELAILLWISNEAATGDQIMMPTYRRAHQYLQRAPAVLSRLKPHLKRQNDDRSGRTNAPAGRWLADATVSRSLPGGPPDSITGRPSQARGSVCQLGSLTGQVG